MDPLTILSIVASSLVIFICWSLKTAKTRKKTPPGPPKLPVIGNIHQLEKQAPHRKLRSLAQKYGPIMHLQLGQVSTVVISTPRLAQEILKIQDLNFANRPAATTPSIFFYNATSIGWANYGNYLREIKKIATLQLFSATKVRSFAHIRENELTHVSNFLGSCCGTPINFRDMTVQLVNNVVSRATLGDVCKDRQYVVDSAFFMLKTFKAFNLFNYYPRLGFLNVITGRKAQWLKMHNELDIILQKILDQHRSKPRSNREHEDMVDVLLRVKDTDDLAFPITDDNIKAIILELLMAGTSSSSMTIEWAFCEMMRNPKIMKRAQAEVRSAVKGNIITDTDIERMHYMKSVVKETMRLHCVPILLPRLNPKDCVVDGYDIPANTTVLINAWACATDPDSWEYPDSFIPERFENSLVSYSGTDFEFLPFGAGRRMCPGLNFGLATVECTIAYLLYHYDWRLPDGRKPHDIDVTEVTRISTLPIHPLQIVPIPMERSN